MSKVFPVVVRTPHICSRPSPSQDEPLTPDDDVDRQLRARKQQSTEDDSAEIEAASFKKFPVEVNSLARVRASGQEGELVS